METKKLTLASLSKQVPDEEAAYTWLESILWRDSKPVCPKCGTIGHAYHLKPKNGGRKTRTGTVTTRKLWKCGSCRRQFTVIMGTCMEGTKIPIRKWVLAFHLLSAAKNGMSSHELGRILEVSHESAWFMSHRIRYAFADKPSTPLSGTIEADETYIGGHRDRLPGVGTLEWKVPVVTLVERDGRAHSTVMPTVNAKNLKGFLTGNADPSSHLMTDQHTGYVPAGKTFASHESVDHKHEEWVRGNVHTNTVEGFFSQLKRSLDGTHHHVSPKHLQRYVSEFDFRYSTRKSSDGERTVAAVKKARGKRLKYEQVTKRPNA